jgi:ABC-type multidrug transport system fused ATPase/permease subunit
MILVRKNIDRSRTLVGRWIRICKTLAPFGRPHIRLFVTGCLVSLNVVLLRLTLPWLFQSLLKPWLSGSVDLLPEWAWLSEISPGFTIGLLLLIAFVLLGYADYSERLNFSLFTIAAIRDLRAAVYESSIISDVNQRRTDPGDFVARLIGDTARIKAGLKGFLVHVAPMGILYTGVSVVLMYVNLEIGLVFIAGGVLVGGVIVLGAAKTFRRAFKYRTKEGRLAGAVYRGWSGDNAGFRFIRVNKSSGRHEAALTRIEGRITWCAHTIFGVAVVVALYLGIRAIDSHELTAGDLFVVVLYALMLRVPIVHLARRGVRTGKILACGERLCEFLISEHNRSFAQDMLPLQDRIELEAIKVRTNKIHGRKRRLGPVNLTVRAGSRILVVGKNGAGKTTLLKVLAGYIKPAKGNFRWDGKVLDSPMFNSLAQHVDYLDNNLDWPRQRLDLFIGVKSNSISEHDNGLLKACGAMRIIDNLSKGFNSKAASTDFSTTERRTLCLSRLLLSKNTVLLLDDLLDGLSKSKARELLRMIFEARSGVTLILTSYRPVLIELFDRLVELKNGKVFFDGSPYVWSSNTDGVESPVEKNVRAFS